VQKQSQLPIAAQLAGAILGMSILESDREHVAERDAEAEMMNQVFRELEARKMSQTINALKTAEAVIGEAIKVAAAQAAGGIDKESGIIAGLSRLGKSSGGAASAAVRLPSLSTKAKLIGGAGVLGAGYVGMKGLQAGRDYLNKPHDPRYGKGPAIQQNVNEFGYPQY